MVRHSLCVIVLMHGTYLATRKKNEKNGFFLATCRDMRNRTLILITKISFILSKAIHLM